MSPEKAKRNWANCNIFEKCNNRRCGWIPPQRYHLPHRPVIRGYSTTAKIRAVFDASVIEKFRQSLNICLNPLSHNFFLSGSLLLSVLLCALPLTSSSLQLLRGLHHFISSFSIYARILLGHLASVILFTCLNQISCLLSISICIVLSFSLVAIISLFPFADVPDLSSK